LIFKKEKKLEVAIEKFLTNTKLKNKKDAGECARDLAKPTRKILLTGLIFGIGSAVYGFIMMRLFFPEVSLSVTFLLNVPWLAGFILGPAIWLKYGPEYRQLIKKHFGEH